MGIKHIYDQIPIVENISENLVYEILMEIEF
jgi:hypothetical protein